MYKKIYIVNNGTTYVKEAIETLKKNTRYEIVSVFCEKNFIEKIFFRLSLILKIDFSKIWMKRTIEKMLDLKEKESLIIVFDSGAGSKKVPAIRKRFKDTKIVFWYWNRIKIEDFLSVKKYSNLIISYDRIDAEKYNINFIPQFYWRKFEDMKLSEEIYDVVFIGFNRGRLALLKKINNFFENKKIKTLFYVIDEHKNNNDPFLKTKFLKYDEIINLTRQSKIILEINQKNQNGLSLRTLEAMFLNKKLITNNMDIKNYDFYNSNNIQIIKKIEDIDLDFFKTPLNKKFLELGKKYTVENWLEKVINLTLKKNKKRK